jgi:DNA polymerase III alpha subunit
MSKKSDREMAGLREQFIAGARSASGIDGATAEQVWDLMAAFAGYGFPKAHAVGYASVATRMAYLKTHYPAEFMAARLAASGGYYSPRVYMSEARRLGLLVRPPHVNHSAEAFTLEHPGTLWMGLGQVRELTRATIQAVMAQRPFVSLDDFLARAQPQHVEALNLLKAGALEGLGGTGSMLATLEHNRWRGRHAAQLGMSFAPPSSAMPEPALQLRSAWEREVLGMPVNVHPLRLVAEQLSRYDLTRSDRLSIAVDQDVSMAGIRLAAHRFSDKQAEPMLLVDMEDEAGIYQVLWSGPALRQYRALLSTREPVLIRGRVRTDRQGCVIVVGREAIRIESATAPDE